MNKKVVIFGAGGHAKVIADIINASGDTVVGFLDDNAAEDSIGKISDWEKYSDCEFVIGIGNTDVRERLSKMNCRWYTAIHPSAVISKTAVIGEGTVIMPNAVVNTNAVVGKHCIINTGASVDHDNVLGDYVHASAGVRLGGTVSVGARTWLGIGAIVINNASICSDCLIGIGTVIIHDICEKGTYVGVPARKL